MKHENFVICRVLSSAFAAPVTKLEPLPEDYVGDFAEPSRPQDCCVVMRRTEGTRGAKTPPRRCRGRRKCWNPKAPERATLCCQAHRAQEQAAKAWHASRKTDD